MIDMMDDDCDIESFPIEDKGIPCPHGKDLIQADIYKSKTCRKCEHWHVNYGTENVWCDLQDEDNIAALNAQKQEADHE
jgi:hypothetical protein